MGLGGGDRVKGGHTPWRLKRRHPALGVYVAGAMLESPKSSTPLSQLGLSQGTSHQLLGLQWGEGSPASGAAPLAPLEIKVDFGVGVRRVNLSRAHLPPLIKISLLTQHFVSSSLRVDCGWLSPVHSEASLPTTLHLPLPRGCRAWGSTP